jgi:hypothetical protein
VHAAQEKLGEKQKEKGLAKPGKEKKGTMVD